MTRSSTALIVTLSALVVAGCSHGTSKHHRTGVVAGTGSPCIGPAGMTHAWYSRLTVPVTLTGTDGVVRVAKVRDPFRYSFTVPAGSYLVREPGARAIRVHVRVGHTVHVRLIALCL